MPPKEKLTRAASRPPAGPAPVAPSPQPSPRPSPLVLQDEATFSRALDALHELDAVLSAALRSTGCAPQLRRREPGLRGLAAIIVSQQVSTASAAAIFGRLDAAFPGLDAASLLAASDEALRTCGLSAGKARTLRAIAAAERDGTLDFAALATADAEAAHAALCTIKGIGPWTADIFLLFCLGHADAWPAGDLAVQEGVRLVLGLDARPDAKALQHLGERWRPLRGVAAHCLWAYYGAVRARQAVPLPVEPLPNAPVPTVPVPTVPLPVEPAPEAGANVARLAVARAPRRRNRGAA